MSKKEVAEKPKAEVPSTLVKDMQADAGKGLEGTDKDSFAIPFLAVLQALSPQVTEEKVKGAKPGQFINTITNELFETVHIIPCGYQRKYIEWVPRDTGGGFVGIHDPIDVDSGMLNTHKDDRGLLYLGDNNLRDTRMHYLMIQSASGQWQPAVLSLSSTQIVKSKRFMSLIQGVEFKDDNGKSFNPPSFGNIYLAKTAKQTNELGTWFGIEMILLERVTDTELYWKCRKFSEEVTAGTVKVSEPVSEEAKQDGDKF